jgi:hypothetical protein
MQELDPTIWLPTLWHFLRSTAHTYPDYPNEVTKRKYYDFIQNLPLFIPNAEFRLEFSRILEGFPISPYLANRDSFFFWIHFVQNRIDRKLGNEEKTNLDHMEEYYQSYKPPEIIISKKFGIQKDQIILGFTITCMFAIALTLAFSKTG